MKKTFDNRQEIPPIKLVLLAEKGLKAARLSKKQKKYLLEKGFEEIYALSELEKETIPPVNPELIQTLLQKHFPIKAITPNELYIKFRENVIESIKELSGWNQPSPAFAYRGSGDGNISFYKEIGKLIVHIEIVRRTDRQADIKVKLTDDTHRERTSFEVELLQEKRCLEIITVPPGGLATLSSIEIGNYLLRIADTKGEIISLSIRMES